MDRTFITVLNVGHADIDHQWADNDVSSPFARIYYIKEGRARLTMGGRTIEATPNHMYLVPPFVPHSYACDANLSIYYMFIYEHGAQRTGTLEEWDFPMEVETNEAVDLLFTNYCMLYPQLSLPYSSPEEFERHPTFWQYAERYFAMDRYARMQLLGMVLILVSYFMKRATPKLQSLDKRLQRVAEYVKDHLAEEMSLDELADVACVSKIHLIRLFRQKMGITPLQYVINKRIQHTQGLLLTTDMTISQIARSVGVKDDSYFIRLFKKHVGFTPQRYRETLM